MTTLSEIKAQYLAAAKAKPIEKYCIRDHEGKIVARSNSPVVHVFNNETDDAYAAEHYQLKEVFNGMKFWYGEESPTRSLSICRRSVLHRIRVARTVG